MYNTNDDDEEAQSLKIRSRIFKAKPKEASAHILCLKYERDASFLYNKSIKERAAIYNNHRVPHSHTDVRHTLLKLTLSTQKNGYETNDDVVTIWINVVVSSILRKYKNK